MNKTSSPAVMNQRSQPQDSLDYFPTPPFATRALMKEVLLPQYGNVKQLVARDPACGELHMVKPLREYFARVAYSDIYDWGVNPPIRDFTFETDEQLAVDGEDIPDFIITNPPFNLAPIFIQKALDIAVKGVAMFVRIGFLPGQGRYHEIYRNNPPTFICIFCERVALIEGAYDPEASTATDYVWLVWLKGMEPQPPIFLPPGMARKYTRLSDLEMAKLGEAARRAEERKKRNSQETDQPDLMEGL